MECAGIFSTRHIHDTLHTTLAAPQPAASKESQCDHRVLSNAVLCSQPPLQGGGIALEAPPEDRPDGGGARGFLQNLEVVISNTLLEGNVAVEGGGLWSAWPMHVINCTIRNNRAEASVRFTACSTERCRLILW